MSKYVIAGEKLSTYVKKGVGAKSTWLHANKKDAVNFERLIQGSARRVQLKATVRTGVCIIEDSLFAVTVSVLESRDD